MLFNKLLMVYKDLEETKAYCDNDLPDDIVSLHKEVEKLYGYIILFKNAAKPLGDKERCGCSKKLFCFRQILDRECEKCIRETELFDLE